MTRDLASVTSVRRPTGPDHRSGVFPMTTGCAMPPFDTVLAFQQVDEVYRGVWPTNWLFVPSLVQPSPRQVTRQPFEKQQSGPACRAAASKP